MNESTQSADFTVAISNQKPGKCAAHRCTDAPTLVATLAYCFCDEQGPDEHGHPGSPEATRDDVRVCEKHGALIAHNWECFESLRNFKAAGIGKTPVTSGDQ